MSDQPEFDGPAWLQPTAAEAIDKYNADKRRHKTTGAQAITLTDRAQELAREAHDHYPILEAHIEHALLQFGAEVAEICYNAELGKVRGTAYKIAAELRKAAEKL